MCENLAKATGHKNTVFEKSPKMSHLNFQGKNYFKLFIS